MKILHTADIHLDEEHEERWEALRHLVEVAEHEEADVLAISGDLFDAEADARRLRNDVRDAFSGISFDVVIIPGNHDAQAFQERLDFGKRAHIIKNAYEPLEYDDVVLWGLPYQQKSGEGILETLHEMGDRMREDDRASVLLYHGELLDAFYGGRDFGDEEGRYMPVKLSYFDDVPVDCVLAGHFHGTWDRWALDNEPEGFFVYAGSPVSVTRRETAPRKATLFTVGETPTPRELKTRYFADVNVTLDPLEDEEDPVEVVRARLDELPPHAAPLLTVGGYVNADALGTTESEIIERLRKLADERCVDASYPLTDASDILQDELFDRFMEKVSKMDRSEDEQMRMRDMMIRAMTEVRG
ncbi:MAG: metallophosphoesterase [Planctomycetota bacterium]